MEINLLGTVDADEVSPVRRGANRKRVVLKEGDATVDPEVADMLDTPWAHEGALVDHLRKEGTTEAVQKSVVGALRLLSSASEDLPPDLAEVVEKLGVEMYARVNRPLNTGHGIPSAGDLFGSAASDEDDPVGAEEGAADTDASVSGPDLDGDATSAEDLGKDDPDMGMVAMADTDADCDDMTDGVMKDGKKPYGDVTYADPGYQSDGKKRYPLDTPEHVRAAWSYINMPKNAGKYKPGQVASIKSRIRSKMKGIGADVKKEDDLEGRIVTAIRKALRRKPGEKPGDDTDDKEPDADSDDTAVNKGGTVDDHAPVPVQKEDGSWDFTNVPDESAPFFRTMIEKAAQTETLLKAATDTLASVVEQGRQREVIQKAESLKFVAPVGDLAEVLKAAHDSLDPEMVEKLEGVLKAANARLESSDLFTELGKTHLLGADSPGDTWSQIEKMADDLVQKTGGEVISKDAAIDRVLQTEAGKRLYEQYEMETLAGGVN